MEYTVAYYNEYFNTGIKILTLDDRRAVKLVRRYFEFPEDITTVTELADYYIGGGSLIELDGTTMITIMIAGTNAVMVDIS